MPTRQTILSRGTERGRVLVRELSREAEASRVERGTSYADLGRTIRLSGTQVARICRGTSARLSIVRAAQLMAALGLELTARAYPVAAPVRDAAQLALLDRLRSRIDGAPGVRWRVEVPVIELPTAGVIDQRAWDAAIDGPGINVRVEAETHLGDLQAVQRRIALKQRDGAVPCVVLLLAETRHHRSVVQAAGPSLLEQFPIPARRALLALARGESPGGNAVIRL